MTHPVLKKLIDRSLDEYLRAKGSGDSARPAYDLDVTRDPLHGDYASNVAFKLARIVRAKPALIAEELAGQIRKCCGAERTGNAVEKVEVAGGGFINFYLTKSSLAEILVEVRTKGESYGRSDAGKGIKVLLEFVSANPTGPLTIAHGRQAAIGDCLARILEATGHEVSKEFYLNDGGRQIRLLGESFWVRYCEHLGFPAVLPEDGYRGAYLADCAAKFADERGDALLKESKTDHEKALEFCRTYAASEMMKGIREDLAAIRVRFDSYFSEAALYKKGAVEKTLAVLSKKGVLYEEDGAVWLRSEDFGDDKNRVVKKSSGEYTYLAPDIAYHQDKFSRGFNRLINLWGPDHHGYIARLKAACQALGHPAEAIRVLIVQLTTLYRAGEPVRMSTRAGEFVTLRELFEEAGVDATRFFFIMRKVDSHLDFDIELAKAKSQENPVYYLQYAHARIQSLLQFSDEPVDSTANLERLSTEEERHLIKVIADYPKTLVCAAELLEPYRAADYLRELAMAFHKFYSCHRVVTENRELTRARLLLCDAVRIVLRNGLELLGISQPDSM